MVACPLIPAEAGGSLGVQVQLVLQIEYQDSQSITKKSCLKKKQKQGWRDGSEVRSTECSSRCPEFKSQQPYGDSQPSVMRSDALF